MKTCHLVRIAALCTPFLVAGSAFAGPFAYVTNYRQELERIDLNSPATVLIGNIGFDALGLAETSSGKLYATDTSGKLYDVTGGIPTPLAYLGPLQVGSLDSNGTTVWGFDNASQRLFNYDPGLNAIIQWSSVISTPAPVNAMAIDSSGDFLAMIGTGISNKFIKINNGTWSTSLINGSMTLPDRCEAMDFLSDGNLYCAVLGDTRYEIDPLTGNVISGFYSGVHRDWADMTTLPGAVPEPASLLSIGVGLAALRRRRKAL